MVLALDDEVPAAVVDGIAGRRTDGRHLGRSTWAPSGDRGRRRAVPQPARRSSPRASTPTLVLLRHGESEWIVENRFQGQAETPLSATAAARRPSPGTASLDPTAPLAARARMDGRWRSSTRRSPARRRPRAPSRARSPQRGRARAARHRAAERGILEIGQGEWEGVTTTRSPAAGRPSSRPGADAHGRTSRPAARRPRRSRRGSARRSAAVLERLGRDYPRGTVDRPQVGGYAGVSPQAGQPWSILVGHDGVFKVVLLTVFDLPLTRFWMFTMALTGITVSSSAVAVRCCGRQPDRAPGVAPRRGRRRRRSAGSERARSRATWATTAARTREARRRPASRRRRRGRRRTSRSSEIRRRRVASRTASRRAPPRCDPRVGRLDLRVGDGLEVRPGPRVPARRAWPRTRRPSGWAAGPKPNREAAREHRSARRRPG